MRALSITETLQVLAKIDASLASIERTAPSAFAAFGGRDAIQARSQMTCIGPIPRLTSEQWEMFATEHANAQRGPYWRG
jgi:hypothetical protein